MNSEVSSYHKHTEKLLVSKEEVLILPSPLPPLPSKNTLGPEKSEALIYRLTNA